MSRNPAAFRNSSFTDIIRQNYTCEDISSSDIIENNFINHSIAIIDTLNGLSSLATVNSIEDNLISLEKIQEAYQHAKAFQDLAKLIHKGFTHNRNETPPNLREYWEVRRRLSTSRNIIFMDDRIVITVNLRKTLYEPSTQHTKASQAFVQEPV